MKKRLPDNGLVLAGPAPLDVTGLLRRASPALLIVGVWMLCHPFKGIVSDSILYVAQALNRLHPEIYGRDIFFAYGSQDDFTLFSVLFAPLVRLSGPLAATMVVVAVGQALWLSGAAALVMRVVPERAAAFTGLVLVAALPSAYAGWGVFGFAEGIATPRPIAEGLSLWALWALCQNRIVLAAIFVVLAALLHPLVTAAVACVGFLYLALGNRRWLLLGVVGVAAIGIAAALDIGPFGRLLQTMDPEWRSVVERRNGYLFPTLWRVKDWGWLAMAVAMNLAGAALLTGWRRRLVMSVVLAGLGGLLVALVGGDLLGNLLLIQVQPFRALWLLHVFGYFGSGIVFRRLWLLKEDGLPLIAAIGFSWLLIPFVNAPMGVCLGAAALAFAVLRLQGSVKPLSPRIKVALYTLTAIFGVFLIGGRVLFIVDRTNVLPTGLGFWLAVGAVTVIDVVVFALLAVTVQRLRPRTAQATLPVFALVIVIVIGGAIAWDRENAWPNLLSAGDEVRPFGGQLPATAQVFWEGDVRGPWLLMQRASYVSFKQGAGLAFNREMTMTIRHRMQVIKPLVGWNLLDTLGTGDQGLPPLPALSRDTLADVCGRDRALDAMVLSRRVDGAYAAEWDMPFRIYDTQAIGKEGGRQPIRTLYLYRCADLR